MAATKTRVSESRNGAEPKVKEVNLQISAPNFQTLKLLLRGTSPLVQNRFGEKGRQMMMDAQEAGSLGKKGRKREPKDFEANFQQARHRSVDGWDGIHAGGFRRAMVDACSIVGFHMTKAKKTLFVIADGYSADGSGLVRITKGEPRMQIHPVRNTSGVADLRARPVWDAGWECVLTIEYDADLFTANDVVNLVARVGRQCGIGEGRANSKESTGCGWGFFEVVPGEQPSAT